MAKKYILLQYRIDVSEEKVRIALSNNNGTQPAGHIIAFLLVKREIEKIKLRAQYNKK